LAKLVDRGNNNGFTYVRTSEELLPGPAKQGGGLVCWMLASTLQHGTR
jgi:hypothetical protein